MKPSSVSGHVLSILTFALLLLSPGPARSSEPDSAPVAPPAGVAIKVQKQYQRLLLKIRNASYVSTASCDARTGELLTDYKVIGPQIDCIAVRLKSPADLSSVENAYENPLKLDGVLVQFTDKDPIPTKGGITVHN